MILSSSKQDLIIGRAYQVSVKVNLLDIV